MNSLKWFLGLVVVATSFNAAAVTVGIGDEVIDIFNGVDYVTETNNGANDATHIVELTITESLLLSIEVDITPPFPSDANLLEGFPDIEIIDTFDSTVVYHWGPLGADGVTSKSDPTLLTAVALAMGVYNLKVTLEPGDFPLVDGDPSSINIDYRFEGTADPSLAVVPIPAAAWLFGSALLGFSVVSRRKNGKVVS